MWMFSVCLLGILSMEIDQLFDIQWYGKKVIPVKKDEIMKRYTTETKGTFLYCTT